MPEEKTIPTQPPVLKTLLTWEAPTRPFKKRTREYFSTIGAIAFLVILILFFIKEWILILAIIALVFLVFVLGTIPPEKTQHQITTLGIQTGGKSYRWEDLHRYWLGNKLDSRILFVQTKIKFPRLLMMLLGEVKDEEIKTLLNKYLPYEEPEKTSMDKASEWLTRKFPLEETSK